MSTDRRSAEPREPVSLVVDYEGADDLWRDYTQNLSTGGAFIHTERALKVGDLVDLQLSFPRLLTPIRISGVVRWVRPVAEGDNGVGIEFVDFDEPVRARLDALLDRIAQRDPDLVQPSLRVLLVEDNPHVARLIREGLSSGRFSTTAFDFEGAANGKEALEIIDESSFDVLLIDVNLPIIDGATVISRVRQMPGRTNIPIIAVSAGGNEAEAESMKAGADFFLDKPMRLRDIVDTMRKLLDFED